jgi:hypothetical protein
LLAVSSVIPTIRVLVTTTETASLSTRRVPRRRSRETSVVKAVALGSRRAVAFCVWFCIFQNPFVRLWMADARNAPATANRVWAPRDDSRPGFSVLATP